MITSLIDVFINRSPMYIKNVSWDGDTLIIEGDEWSFSTLSAWRIISSTAIEFACWDKDIDELVRGLNGLSIVSVRPQGSTLDLDPVFGLSDGRLLEVFSTDTVEPWILMLPDNKVYVGGT